MNFFALLVVSGIFIASGEISRQNSLEQITGDDRIVGGETARPGQFPYMAALRYSYKWQGTVYWRGHLCSGGILSSRWIVSCASCTQNRYSNVSNLVIVVGSHHVSNDGRIYHLNRIVNHPAFHVTGARNDVSLLRTVKQIEIEIGFVESISLRKQFVGSDTAAVISGWGHVKVKHKFCSISSHNLICFLHFLNYPSSSSDWSLSNAFAVLSGEYVNE